MTSAEDVLEVLDMLDQADMPAWIGGGWGIDALVGHQTRIHEDVDIAVDATNEASTIDVLTALGFRVVEGP